MIGEDLKWAAVLAGGKNSRFGSNKALALWKGEPLIAAVIRQLYEFFDHVMIISDDADSYGFTGCPVYPDPLPGKGPLAGLCSALDHCGGEYLFLTACDMPLVSGQMIDKLRNRILEEGPDAAAVRTGGLIQPFGAFYRRTLLERIDPASGKGLYSLIKVCRTSVIGDYEEILININRPEDLEILRNPEL